VYDIILLPWTSYHGIIYDIRCDLLCNILFGLQVAAVEKQLKMKIRPQNAYFKLTDHDFLSHLPREELHQFLIGTYGEYVIPSSMHLIKKVLRKPEFILRHASGPGGITKHLVSNAMLTGVWERLRDRLSAIDSSTSMIQVTVEYAAHFYDMYVEGHTGKHLSGDRIRILLLNLPFLFRDLIAPEVMMQILCTFKLMIS
jgi:hypothetical protein